MEKPTIGEKFRALLATGRVANLPTVWSNVLVGFWIASSFIHGYDSGSADSFRLCLLASAILTASFFYLGGCMLGDYRDISHDCINRPNRPLPTGVLSPTTISISAWLLIISGLFLTASSTLIIGVISGVVSFNKIYLVSKHQPELLLILLQVHEIIIASILVACIIAYAYLHKKNRARGVILIALCRVLLVLFAISVAHKTFMTLSWSPGSGIIASFSWLAPWMVVLAGAVGLYTLLLSCVASTESSPSPFSFRKTLGICMLSIPFVSFWLIPLTTDQRYKTWWLSERSSEAPSIPIVITVPHITFFVLAIAGILFSLYLLKYSKPSFVSHALAGFCLLDACFIAPFAPKIALICLLLYLLALLLQRVTPAT